MAHFRLEAAYDEGTDLYYIEIFNSAEATVPFVRTRPRFRTREEGFEEAKRIMEEGLGKPIRDLKPN